MDEADYVGSNMLFSLIKGLTLQRGDVATETPVLPNAGAEQATLGTIEVERPAFAKLLQAELTTNQYTAEEKFEILKSALEESRSSDGTRLNLAQFEMIQNVLDETLQQIENPRSLVHRAARLGADLRDFIGMDRGAIHEAEQKMVREITQFMQHDAPVVQARVLAGEKFSDIVQDYPLIERATERYNLDFSGKVTQEQVLGQYADLIKYHREARSYDDVAAIGEQALAVEFNEAVEKLPPEKRAENKAKAEEEIAKKLEKYKDELQDLSGEQIEAYSESLIEERAHQLDLKDALKTEFNPDKLVGSKARIWQEYNDSLDPRGETTNIKDSSADFIMDELIINAPLILASGGTASLVRAGVGATARVAVGRIAAREAFRRGVSLGTRELAEAGGKKLARFAGRSTANKIGLRVGSTAGGLLVEGAVFETAHLGLQGEWIGNMPDWGERCLWASAALGMFHGAGSIGERAFTKTVMSDGAKTTLRTALGEQFGRISNPAVREAAKQLMVKGHLEASAMLTMGAVQNGAYEGNVDEFMNNIGEEIFHAYVTVGALKVSHAGVQTMKGTLFPTPSKENVAFKTREYEVGKARQESNPLLLNELPEVVKSHLAGTGLHWYEMSVRVDPARVDPFFRELARRVPEGELVIGAGSDLVQFMLPAPKEFNGSMTDVNVIMSPEALKMRKGEEQTLFQIIEGVPVPAFRGRPEGVTDVVYNGESAIDLQTTIRNAQQGRHIIDGRPNINIPFKHDAIAVVPADGPVTLFFRTPTEYVRFVQKKMSLPDVDFTSAKEWLASIAPEDAAFHTGEVLAYNAKILERGKPEGWKFNDQSLEFLQAIAKELTPAERADVCKNVRQHFRESGTKAPTLEQTFVELGLKAPERTETGRPPSVETSGDSAVLPRDTDSTPRVSALRLPEANRTAPERAFDNPYLEVVERTKRENDYIDQGVARIKLVREYSWAIPNEAAMQKIAEVSPNGVVEIGAGTGYWSRYLRERGVDVAAYDIKPRENSWTEVQQGDATAASMHPEKTLLLCWPPHGNAMASEALRNYRGRTLVFVGEPEVDRGFGVFGEDALTGDAAFHQRIRRDWQEVEQVYIPNWDLLADRLIVYRRKQQPEQSPGADNQPQQ